MTRGWIVKQERGALLIDEHGRIIRTDMAFAPSGQWLFRSIEKAEPFGRLRALPHKTLNQLDILAGMSARSSDGLSFKNGKPRFYLGDTDHGTARVQMNGIKRVVAVNMWPNVRGFWDYEARVSP